MKKNVFKRERIEKQLLIYCNSYTQERVGDFNNNFTSNYYEIHFAKSNNYELFTNNLKINLTGNHIIFLPPKSIRRMNGIIIEKA